MKKWPVIVLVAVLIGTNVCTMVSLSRAATRAGSDSERANTAEAEVRSARQAARDAEFRAETAERALEDVKAATRSVHDGVMVGVVERWQKLYESTRLPVKVGDQIEFYTVSSITSERIEAKAGGAVKIYAWPDVPESWKARVAITLLDARTSAAN